MTDDKEKIHALRLLCERHTPTNMANFDIAELALKSICPSNTILYDDKEMPSIMVYIPKFRLCDVLSTTDTSVHPAFRKGGLEVDGVLHRQVPEPRLRRAGLQPAPREPQRQCHPGHGGGLQPGQGKQVP